MTEVFSLKRLLIKNTVVQMGSHVISLGIGLLTTMVLSRYLGVERFGQFNYIFAFFYFFLTLNDFGINTVMIRAASQERNRAGEIIGAMLSFKLLLAVVSILIAWAVISVMHFPPDLRNALYLYAPILLVIALQLPSVIFQVVLKLEYPSIIGIFKSVISFLLLMTAVWKGYGLPALGAVLVLSEVIYLLVLLKYAKGFVPIVFKWDPPIWKDILRPSITIGMTGFFVALINRVDFMMLERMTDLKQLGLYSASYRVTNLLEAFPLMWMGTIYPLMSQYANGDFHRLKTLYKKSVSLLGLIGLALGIGVTLLSSAIIRMLFGIQFGGAEKGLRILVWSTVFAYLAISGGNLLISLGKERMNLFLLASAAFVNISLNFLWIPSLGFVGAALSTTIAYFVILIGTIIATEFFLSHESHPPFSHLF